MITTLESAETESIELINAALAAVVHKITLPLSIELIIDILSRLYPEISDDNLYEMILFKTDPNISFPKSDIEKIEFSRNGERMRVEITVGFLSIFGASSPLPMHYNEKVLEDSQNERVLLDFLDMLNHRLKKLVYPIWVKQRYYVQYRPDLRDRFSKYVLSMLGLYSSAEDIPAGLRLHKLLPFSGILSMQSRPKATLATVLKHYFDHESISIEEGALSKAVIPEDQHAMLGGLNSTLGEDMSIGLFVLTRSLKFKIVFNDISWSDLALFATDGNRKRELETLVRFVERTPLDYDLCITIKKDEIKRSELGKAGCVLGVDTWIGTSTEDQMIIL